MGGTDFSQDRSFDEGWRFYRGDALVQRRPDSTIWAWRTVDTPPRLEHREPAVPGSYQRRTMRRLDLSRGKRGVSKQATDPNWEAAN